MANRWFFDTEFNDTGSRIDLISIGLVSEDGREYYAVSSEFDPERCLPWVKENVLPSLVGTPTKTREQISEDILALVGPNPEFWAYYADYDWVVLCQLYGPMVWLPKSWPMFCMDLKQEMTRLGIEREQLPDNPREHNALEDARWLRDAYRQLLKRIIADRAALDGMVREWATIAHTAREDALNRNDKTAVAALAREAWTYEACATQLRRHLDGQ